MSSRNLGVLGQGVKKLIPCERKCRYLLRLSSRQSSPVISFSKHLAMFSEAATNLHLAVLSHRLCVEGLGFKALDQVP